MKPEQQELETAIANVDKIVSAFHCDGPTRYAVDANWRLIVVNARGEAHPAPAAAKDDADAPPA